MKEKKETYTDFGAPETFGAHIFRVEIPDNRTDDVVVIEDYGYKGSENGIPKEEERVYLKRATWNAISDIAKREFNDRLKAAKIQTGRWHAGENLLDRLLGKELCVLAWAAESSTDENVGIICTKWAALRPEERWWLFSMTAAEAGLPEDTGRGWRKALFHALSEGPKKAAAKKRRRPVESDVFELPLFGGKEL
jgi:23S rRNA G2069 N7-methylase RlmK/C1962 C5-methylase RlmI